MYTLPSHLSHGARGLIPRMLVADPMKRIMILEIRQHHWFKDHLPHYLAVSPPDARGYLKQAPLPDLCDSYKEWHLDEEIIQEVLRMRFGKNKLIESLQNRMQNDATVAYYLLLDNRSPVFTGYLGGEFQESKDLGLVAQFKTFSPYFYVALC
ncbi:SNF1-related kinase catalytic subunit alpha KIN10-like [Olea europaea subsp. europaea]|uniref:SNF1-related kinase catalytic subunit alpha KIN10-like n=1 Tax=Olea europaea subsp. europaea TaxID=158383 RepID=A0A8S0TXG5_OLEEU|nr:SNF1-related kinase catalytic subunit alpha KIN10-like [Olea europaea subsp. europaea]